MPLEQTLWWWLLWQICDGWLDPWGPQEPTKQPCCFVAIPRRIVQMVDSFEDRPSCDAPSVTKSWNWLCPEFADTIISYFCISLLLGYLSLICTLCNAGCVKSTSETANDIQATSGHDSVLCLRNYSYHYYTRLLVGSYQPISTTANKIKHGSTIREVRSNWSKSHVGWS